MGMGDARCAMVQCGHWAHTESWGWGAGKVVVGALCWLSSDAAAALEKKPNKPGRGKGEGEKKKVWRESRDSPFA